MFSKELESLIQATLEDGILEDNEKAALVKRAQAEGVDLAELEIYINSIMQKRQKELDAKRGEEYAKAEMAKKEAIGKVCPHCGTPIPPLAEKCPSCGTIILTAAINQKLEKQMAEIKETLSDAIGTELFNPEAKQKALGLANSAKSGLIQLYTVYSTVPAIQSFYTVMKPEIDSAITKIEKTKTYTSKMLMWCLILIIGIMVSFILLVMWAESNKL